MDLAASATTFTLLLFVAACAITAVIIVFIRRRINHEVIMASGKWLEVDMKIKSNAPTGNNGQTTGRLN